MFKELRALSKKGSDSLCLMKIFMSIYMSIFSVRFQCRIDPNCFKEPLFFSINNIHISMFIDRRALSKKGALSKRIGTHT